MSSSDPSTTLAPGSSSSPLGTLAGVTPNSPSFANVLKTSSITSTPSPPLSLAPPNPWTTSSYSGALKRVSKPHFIPTPTPSQNSSPFSILRSFSANALVADFSGFSLTKEEALQLIHSQVPLTAGLKFLKQGHATEIQFDSAQHLQATLDSGLSYQNRLIPLTRCFRPEACLLPITIRGIPCYPKDQTVQEIQSSLELLGSIQEVRFHYYGSTSIRMDSLSILLKCSVPASAIPRQIRIFGAACDMFWKDAPAFCRYCKHSGHTVRICPKLGKRKQPHPPIQEGSSQQQLPSISAGSSPQQHLPIHEVSSDELDPPTPQESSEQQHPPTQQLLPSTQQPNPPIQQESPQSLAPEVSASPEGSSSSEIPA